MAFVKNVPKTKYKFIDKMPKTFFFTLKPPKHLPASFQQSLDSSNNENADKKFLRALIGEAVGLIDIDTMKL